MRVPSFSILKRIVLLPEMNFLAGSTRTSEVVIEQIVVGAIRAICAAQDVSVSGRGTACAVAGAAGFFAVCAGDNQRSQPQTQTKRKTAFCA